MVFVSRNQATISDTHLPTHISWSFLISTEIYFYVCRREKKARKKVKKREDGNDVASRHIGLPISFYRSHSINTERRPIFINYLFIGWQNECYLCVRSFFQIRLLASI